MSEPQPSQFQQYLAAEAAKSPIESSRGTYFHDKERFHQTFSRYGKRIEDAVGGIIWDGQSLDWLNLALKHYRENDPDNESFWPTEKTTADLTDVYESETVEGTGSEIYSKSYENLSEQDRVSLMMEIINELAGNIIDYKAGLSPEEKTTAATLRTENFYRPDYSDQNTSTESWVYESREHRKSDPYVRNTEDYEAENPELGTYEFVIKQAINELGKIDSNPELVDYLLQFWNESKDPYFGPAIATAISRNNAEVGAARILEDLKTADQADQNRLLSLLYRLELGRVGISEQGVNYLGRQFDIGMTTGFVSRLTASGQVGVFDELKRLVGLFQLESGDFTSEHEGAIQKNLLAITLEMLFTPRADETPEERVQKESLLEEFKTKYWQTYIELFAGAEEKSGFRFNNLSLPEQGFVLLYLDKYPQNSPEHKRFFDFLEKYGEDGFRAFRSVEFDPEAGEKILDVGTRLPINEVRERFSQYAKVYSAADMTAQWVKKVLRVDMTNPAARDLLEANLIREQILREAQDALTYSIAAENQEEAFDNHGQPIAGHSLSGVEWLSVMNYELEMVVAMEPTIENFTQAQFILGRYLTDLSPTGDRLSISEQVISDGLARLYDNREFSLRDYEGKTSDTTLSLMALLHGMEEMPSQKATGDSEEQLVYDIGAGDGRMDIPLALSGRQVVGIDISDRMVEDSHSRPSQFVMAFRNDRDDYLVGSVRKAFDTCDLDITDENLAQVPNRIDIRQANFNNFGPEEFRQNFGERQPDVVVIMWHTLGFVRGVEGMKTVLRNAYNILRPGGRIFIEMPDRNFGGYARAIRDFHNSNPDEPFGALRDAPSKSGDSPTEQNEDRATWRYFPKNSEIVDTLSAVGFDASVAFPQSYFVLAGEQSIARPLIKENLFVAEKPLDPARQQYMREYVQSLSRSGSDQDQERIEEVRDEIRRAA